MENEKEMVSELIAKMGRISGVKKISEVKNCNADVFSCCVEAIIPFVDGSCFTEMDLEVVNELFESTNKNCVFSLGFLTDANGINKETIMHMSIPVNIESWL